MINRGRASLRKAGYLTSSTFIRFEFLPRQVSRPQSRLLRVRRSRGRDPSLRTAFLNQVRGRSHVLPVFPCREQGNSEA